MTRWGPRSRRCEGIRRPRGCRPRRRLSEGEMILASRIGSRDGARRTSLGRWHGDRSLQPRTLRRRAGAFYEQVRRELRARAEAEPLDVVPLSADRRSRPEPDIDPFRDRFIGRGEGLPRPSRPRRPGSRTARNWRSTWKARPRARSLARSTRKFRSSMTLFARLRRMNSCSSAAWTNTSPATPTRPRLRGFSVPAQ